MSHPHPIGSQRGRRGGGSQASCAWGNPLPSPRARPGPTPTQLFSEAPGFLHPHPPTKHRLPSPFPRRSVRPRVRAHPPGGCCCVYCPLTIELCGLELPPQPCQPPPPPRARIQPRAGQGDIVGTHGARDRRAAHLCASGHSRGRGHRLPAPPPPALPRGTSRGELQQQASLPPHRYSNAAHGLLGGGGEACLRAVARGASGYRQAAPVQPHLGIPPGGLQGGRTPLPETMPAPMLSLGPGCPPQA